MAMLIKISIIDGDGKKRGDVLINEDLIESVMIETKRFSVIRFKKRIHFPRWMFYPFSRCRGREILTDTNFEERCKELFEEDEE